MSDGAPTTADAAIDVDALRRELDGPRREQRELVREGLRRAELAPVHDLDTATYRQRVMDQMRAIAAEGATGLGFPEEYGGGGDVGARSPRSRPSRSGTCRCW